MNVEKFTELLTIYLEYCTIGSYLIVSVTTWSKCRSYLEMERRFKVYVYEEGESPLVHDGPCKDIYTSEGRFIHEMEQGNNGFRTRNPEGAHVYFLPFSVTLMVKYLYHPNTYNVIPLKEFVSDYVRIISRKHPFWNKTQGADHFMISCHDWFRYIFYTQGFFHDEIHLNDRLVRGCNKKLVEDKTNNMDQLGTMLQNTLAKQLQVIHANFRYLF
ncbi:probable glycosyltransferase At5g25310 [Olea europaea var. sylvestris]|uniref:probable glycosyltransferase At5g25310 n=1 Tax=Olea europaea var. sylvestris TaxID=158386 RepID=UPI000C1CEEFD|nr:probable glycosyltransferase At5g25310 [Olea europaea var. sylvestris]